MPKSVQAGGLGNAPSKVISSGAISQRECGHEPYGIGYRSRAGFQRFAKAPQRRFWRLSDSQSLTDR